MGNKSIKTRNIAKSSRDYLKQVWNTIATNHCLYYHMLFHNIEFSTSIIPPKDFTFLKEQ